MSHLGNRLSALVDGELDGGERDRVSAHLARCEQCRAEAAGLRDLKRQLRFLGTDTPAVAAAEAALMRRLMAMTGIGAEPPQRRLRVLSRPSGAARGHAGLRALGLPKPFAGQPGAPGGSQRPGGPRRPSVSRAHRRYLVLGTVSIVVSLGTAAFTAGGGDPSPGPKITPQMELYSQEHAITTGEVPFAGSTAGGTGSAGAAGTSGSTGLPAFAPASISPSATALDSGRPAQEP
jgi:anti-sigma factor RsiW